VPAGEVVGHILFEVVLELMIKGPGYFIARNFRRDANPDGAASVIAGLLFWAALGGMAYAVYRMASA